MHWWAWLVIGWPLLALLLATRLGPALAVCEADDWVRRGRPERRTVDRYIPAPGITIVPPPRAAARRIRSEVEQFRP